MRRVPDRIHVECPRLTINRERIEAAFLEELEANRRLGANIPGGSGGIRTWMLGVAACALAVASGLAWWIGFRSGTRQPAAIPTAADTLAAGTGSTMEIPQGVLTTKSGTEARVLHGHGGAVVVELDRGQIECDVTYRNAQPPLVVKAGEITLSATETRFAVARTDEVRVVVSRGTVKVDSPIIRRYLGAGETWTSPATVWRSDLMEKAADSPCCAGAGTGYVAPGVVDSDAGSSPEGAVPTGKVPSARTSRSAARSDSTKTEGQASDSTLHAASSRSRDAEPVGASSESHAPEPASRVVMTDPSPPGDVAAPPPRVADAWTLRKRANGRGAAAAASLFSLAGLEHSHGRSAATLAIIAEYERRFPSGAESEEIAWLRVRSLRGADQTQAAREAAGAYLRRYPSGTHLAAAQALIEAE